MIEYIAAALLVIMFILMVLVPFIPVKPLKPHISDNEIYKEFCDSDVPKMEDEIL